MLIDVSDLDTAAKEKDNLADDEELLEAIHVIALKLTPLDEAQKGTVIQTLDKYRLLFSNKLGCAKSYQ